MSHQVLATKKLDHKKLANEFITVLNSKNLNKIEKFVIRNFSPDSLAQWDGSGKERYIGYSMNEALFHGELIVISTELDTSTNPIRHISKIYSKNTDMQYEMTILFSNAQEQAITRWYINESLQNQDLNVSLTEPQLIDEIKTYTVKLAQNGVFSGTILLAKDKDILFTAAHGLASVSCN